MPTRFSSVIPGIVLLHEPSLLISKSMVIIPLFVHVTPIMSQILLLLQWGRGAKINNTGRFFLGIQPTREADSQEVNT